MYRHKQYTGFTIVELVIVIAVISILAVISVVAYTGTQDRASSAAAIAQAKAMIGGLQIWEAQTGARPSPSSCIAPASVGTTCSSSDFWYSNTPRDATFNTTLLNYSSLQTVTLNKWGNVPVGSMWYHDNYWGDNRSVFMYAVSPREDCGLPGVLSPNPNYDNMTLLNAKYTHRDANRTACIIEVAKW